MVMLAKNLSVKGFIQDFPINSGTVNNLSSLKGGLQAQDSSKQDISIGSSTDQATLNVSPSAAGATWIVTEDNFAYTAVLADGGTKNEICGSKLDINSKTTIENTIKEGCFTVIVDVNGLNKSPNVVEPQITNHKAETTSNTLDTLSGDQYYIFIGRDGATAGNAKLTATGRLVGDVK